MTSVQSDKADIKGRTFAPLREPVFRRIWTASLLSNFGQLILGVGAQWEMLRLTNDSAMVAMVQTAMLLPLMLVSMPAGAVADMFDHRKIAMTGLSFAIIFSAMLSTIANLGLTTPWLLLIFCALIGAGNALFSPAWQASTREQVSPARLPAAVALGSISYNVARSVGPAIGGLIVATAGARAGFAINTICYVPILLAFFFWQRERVPSRLPPERIDRAIQSGFRFTIHSPMIRKVLMRAFLFGLSGAAYSSLAAPIARDLLHGKAETFGLLLAEGGAGAVIGAMLITPMRERLGVENSVRLFALVSVFAIALMGWSRNLFLTGFGFFLAGGSNILIIGLFNISVQMSVPRWVTARALSLFSSALTGGIAIGSLLWGRIAVQQGVTHTLYLSAGALFVAILIGLLMPLPRDNHSDLEQVEIGFDPDVALDLSLRSGPIVISLEYSVDPENARSFYDAMRGVYRMRMRNGGFNWSLARDIADPVRWTERYQCPTWGDYLRVRDRFTEADRAAQEAADAFLIPGSVKHVRRRLERPFGSVRWQPDSPDSKSDNIGILGH